MNNLLFVVRSVLSHHVRAMERRTLRTGMELAWLKLDQDEAETEAQEKFSSLDTDYCGEESEDTVNFVTLLNETNEAESFLLSVAPLKEDPEFSYDIEYLEKLTRLATLRMKTIASDESHANVALGTLNW